MTATLPTESKSPSRRALLAGALGGLGAWAASAIGRANPVRAEGEAIVIGGEYFTAQSLTSITNNTNGQDVFAAESKGVGIGVKASSKSYYGVLARSESGTALQALCSTGVAVDAYSVRGIGLKASSSDTTGLRAEAFGASQTSVYARKQVSGTAVWGEITDPTSAWAAVYGSTDGTGPGVYGYSSSGSGVLARSGTGAGLRAEAVGADQTSVYARKVSTGTAVWGEIDKPDSSWGAVFGSTNGLGPGVIGTNTVSGNGLHGRALGSSGAGVFAESTNGRGGIFAGKKAQIRLNPSTASTHPSGGTAGDLFVDASARLWFCTGGTSWVQLA